MKIENVLQKIRPRRIVIKVSNLTGVMPRGSYVGARISKLKQSWYQKLVNAK